MAVWGDDFSPIGSRPGVRVAAEHLVVARLLAFDSHRWKVHELPAHWWICQDCLLPLEATGLRRCAGSRS